MALASTGFHVRKKFSKNYSQFGHASLRIFDSPDLNLKKKKRKNVGFKGRQIIRLSGALTRVMPATAIGNKDVTFRLLHYGHLWGGLLTEHLDHDAVQTTEDL